MLTHGALIRLCRARDLLRETHDRPLSIRDVAQEAGLSPYHFIRQFLAVFGQTPHQFRIQARLDRAKYLLTVTDHSVTAVCMEVGFASLGSFSDLFTRRVGLAPSAYRPRVQALVQVPGILPRELIPGCLNLMCAAPMQRSAIFEKQ